MENKINNIRIICHVNWNELFNYPQHVPFRTHFCIYSVSLSAFASLSFGACNMCVLVSVSVPFHFLATTHSSLFVHIFAKPCESNTGIHLSMKCALLHMHCMSLFYYICDTKQISKPARSVCLSSRHWKHERMDKMLFVFQPKKQRK